MRTFPLESTLPQVYLNSDMLLVHHLSPSPSGAPAPYTGGSRSSAERVTGTPILLVPLVLDPLLSLIPPLLGSLEDTLLVAPPPLSLSGRYSLSHLPALSPVSLNTVTTVSSAQVSSLVAATHGSEFSSPP